MLYVSRQQALLGRARGEVQRVTRPSCSYIACSIALMSRCKKVPQTSLPGTPWQSWSASNLRDARFIASGSTVGKYQPHLLMPWRDSLDPPSPSLAQVFGLLVSKVLRSCGKLSGILPPDPLLARIIVGPQWSARPVCGPPLGLDALMAWRGARQSSPILPPKLGNESCMSANSGRDDPSQRPARLYPATSTGVASWPP